MTVLTVRLPDLGEGLTESDLVDWEVAPGDLVALNQVLAEVETAKALVELPSPYAGVVAELLVEPGTTVRVGGALLTITVEETVAADRAPDAPPSAQSSPDGPVAVVPRPQSSAEADHAPEEHPGASAPAPAAAPARTPVLVGYGAPIEGPDRPRRRARSATWTAAHALPDAPAAPAPEPTPEPPTQEHAARPVTNPLVRKLAHDLGVHLELLVGSGADGGITRDDVLHAVSGAAVRPDATRRPSSAPLRAVPPLPSERATGSRDHASPAPSTEDRSADVHVPVTGVRKQTAAAMVASAFTAPHASVFLDVDVTPTLDLLAQLRADPAFADRHLTVLALASKAVLVALGRNPALNAHWDDAAGEIVRYGHVGLGIAAATPRGLLVPVVHEADRLRLPELASAIRDLAEGARAGTTPPSDLAGGTFTITNVGVFGVDGGTPILVPGQAGILALGAVRRRPWEHEGAVALRSVLTLTMSFDHRVVDGAEAAHFLADVGAVLARPGAVLAMV